MGVAGRDGDDAKRAAEGTAAEELRKGLLRIIVGVVAVMSPITYVIFGFEIARGNTSPWLWGYLIIQVVGPLSVLLTRRTPRVAGKIVIVYVSMISFVTTVQFGPLLGTGAMLVAASLLATIFLSIRAMAAVQVVAVAAVVFADRYSPAQFESVVWLRATITYLVVCTGLALIVDRTLKYLEAENRKLEASIKREREQRVARQQADKELARSRRLESLGRLAGGIAHDVNNSLTVILSNAQFAAQHNEDEEMAEVLEDILVAANASQETIAQLMLLGRSSGEESGVCKPCRTISTIGRTFAKVLPENVEMTLSTNEADDGWVSMAPSSLEQILLNLVINAKDAMPNGGRLDVKSRWRDEEWILTVRDTGAGMDDETLQRAMEPFFTTKDVDQGTGLGLSMVDARVRRSGGTVDIQSSPGKGTTIRICLPKDMEAESRVGLPPVSKDSTAALRVLIVEDERMVRRALRRLLERDGHELREAEDEASAVEVLSESEFDLVITDCVMPRSKVSRIIDAIEHKQPTTRIILCSGWTSEEGQRELEAGRVSAFVRKPFDLDGIRATIAEVMEDRAFE